MRIHDLPRWILFLAFIGLAMGGALLPSWFGAACLLLLGAFLGWLTYLAWPSLDRSKRLTRLLVLGVVVGAALVRGITG